jgi:hypothetical protein
MDVPMSNPERKRVSPWRVAGWSLAALLLLIPLVAMQLGGGVNWTAGDFIFATLLILSVGIPLEVVSRRAPNVAYKVGAGLARAAGFMIIWANGAVGIIGSENNPVNIVFPLLVLAVIIGSVVTLFRPRGMAIVTALAALAHAAIAIVAIFAGWGIAEAGPVEIHSDPIEILAVSALFIGLWAGAAALFWQSAEAVDAREGGD